VDGAASDATQMRHSEACDARPSLTLLSATLPRTDPRVFLLYNPGAVCRYNP
jgi:hypothetical protein